MSLLEIQPASCRQPLDPKPLKGGSRLRPVVRRVITFDPGPAFERIAGTADPFKRLQVRTNISMLQLFPRNKNGICDCGCGRPLAGRHTRWAEPACSEFAWYVYAIIAGRREEIRRCMRAYYGRKCNGCHKMPSRADCGLRIKRSGLELDHIIPVHLGGGACWLSNYRPLCVSCHQQKTAANRLERTLKAL